MQTLNVGAGQSDADYKQAQEQQRKDLLSEASDAANYFFGAAGLAALGTGLLPIRINLFVSIGCFDLIGLYGRSLGPLYPAVLYGFALLWVAVMVGLGFAGRSGQRWAFIGGIVIYGVDLIALLVTFSIWSFAVHGVFIFKWYQGQKALKDSTGIAAATA
jgi:hypothetical protein